MPPAVAGAAAGGGQGNAAGGQAQEGPGFMSRMFTMFLMYQLVQMVTKGMTPTPPPTAAPVGVATPAGNTGVVGADPFKHPIFNTWQVGQEFEMVRVASLCTVALNWYFISSVRVFHDLHSSCLPPCISHPHSLSFLSLCTPHLLLHISPPILSLITFAIAYCGLTQSTFLSFNETVDAQALFSGKDASSPLIWHSAPLRFDWSPVPANQSIEVDAAKLVPGLLDHVTLRNGSVYAHTYMYKRGAVLDPNDKAYDHRAVVYRKTSVNSYGPRPKVVKKRNLIAGEEASEKEDEAVAKAAEKEEAEAAAAHAALPWTSYWRPTLSLRVLPDATTYPANSITPDMKSYINIVDGNHMEPVAYYDYFWSLKSTWNELNATKPLTELPLTVSYEPVGMMAWRVASGMQFTWENPSMLTGMSVGSEEKDREELKRMFLETNPVLLAVTMVVSVVHMAFDFLAFKSDIAFWKDTKSTEGLSVTSLLFGAFSQLVIFLYLFDNETSWMVLLSAFVSVFIDFWKITKATDVTFTNTYPFVHMKDKEEHADSESSKIDREARTYFSYAIFPLVACYAAYALVYESHKSWYSFILGTLVGTVYTFGFITMIPQLYLNYKLQSVAHLPWRMLTYKALNTFIDDLFAFIIKMPTLHRLACFRDDIIFLVFLYQKWKYRTDYTRVNEFGVSFNADGTPITVEDAEAAEKKKKNKEESEQKSGADKKTKQQQQKGSSTSSTTSAAADQPAQAEDKDAKSKADETSESENESESDNNVDKDEGVKQRKPVATSPDLVD